MDPTLEAAQSELAAKVMDWPGVTGVAVGERGGRPCLMVYVSDARTGKKVPGKVRGFPVVVEVTGAFKRL